MAYATTRCSITTFLYVVTIFVFPLINASPQEIFLQADEAYKKGSVDQACNLWQSLATKTDRVYFNLARCMQKKGDIHRAHFYLRKARVLSDPAFLPVVDHALDQLTAHQVRLSERMLRSIERISRAFSLGFWQCILLMISVAVFLSWYYAYSRYLRALIIIILSFTVGCAVLRFRQLQTIPGMIIQNESCVYLIPRADVDCSAMLAVGQQVEILQKRDQWYKIRHQDSVGWVHAHVLSQE